MKILVIGGGGREHALVWKLKQSDKVDSIFCAPGNAGIQQIATCIAIAVNDIPGLLQLCPERKDRSDHCRTGRTTHHGDC